MREREHVHINTVEVNTEGIITANSYLAINVFEGKCTLFNIMSHKWNANIKGRKSIFVTIEELFASMTPFDSRFTNSESS